MDKLQDVVDRIFGDVAHKPAEHPLSNTAARRDAAFAEDARKLEALRAARLAKSQSKPPRKRHAE